MSLSASSSKFHLMSNESQKLQDPQLVARALVDVIREFYIANNIMFDLIIYGNSTRYIDDIINHVTKELSMEEALVIRQIRDITKWNHFWTQSAVILTNSEKNLVHLTELSTFGSFQYPKLLGFIPKKFKFLVFTQEITTVKQLRDAIKSNSKNVTQIITDMRFFELFLINGRKNLDLVANVLFSENNCGFFVQNILNAFDKLSEKWSKKLKNFEFFENFDGCMLTTTSSYGLSIYTTKHPRKFLDLGKSINGNSNSVAVVQKTEYHGLISELMQILAYKYNFSINFIMESSNKNDSSHYAILANNYKPSFKSLFRIKVDDRRFSHGSFLQRSNPLSELKFYYLITQNDLYGNYEKMFLAFDLTTWILILIVYGFTFVIIAALRLSSLRIRKIVFGKGINIPAYNALGIFFGIGQIKLPEKNFGRFILLIYIWFCLMIRTCYQSKMFEFITSDMRKPLPETIEDLKYWNYTIVTPEDIYWDINENIINGREKPNIINETINGFILLYEDAIDKKSVTKYAFIVDSGMHSTLNSTFRNSLKIMSDERTSNNLAVKLSVHKFLFRNLNYIIDQLIPSGIPNHLLEYAQWFLYRPFDIDVEDPRRVLTLEMLEFGFVLWFAACCLSTLVFLYECRFYLIKIWKELFGLINFKFVLKENFKVYNDRW